MAWARVSATETATIQSTPSLPINTPSNFNKPFERRVTVTPFRILIAKSLRCLSKGVRFVGDERVEDDPLLNFLKEEPPLLVGEDMSECKMRDLYQICTK